MNETATRPDTVPSATGSTKLATQSLKDKVFFFPDGLPAFEEVHQFFFACRPETAPFLFMRALEPVHLGFVCIDPFLIRPGYKLDLSDADTAFLDIAKPDEVLVLSIVTPSPDVRQTTANLQSPLVVNLRTCRGRQIIGADTSYPVRYAIWEELKHFAREAPLPVPAAEGSRSAA